MALAIDTATPFIAEVRRPEVASAVMEVDALVDRLFVKHFGNADDLHVQADYLEGILRFAIDALPPATERYLRIPEGDWRKPTAGHHTLDGDIMWFAWALQLEAADAIATHSYDQAAGASSKGELPAVTEKAQAVRRALLLAGVAIGCPANFVWRGHRRTRAEYHPDAETMSLLRDRGLRWASDFSAAAGEIHALYRIREWGQP